MESQSIKARIRVAFQDIPDKAFFFTTDLDIVGQLGVEYNNKLKAIQIGKKNILKIEGRNYEVVNIYTNFYNEIFENNHSYDDGYGKVYPFNLELTYEVKEVK